MGMTKAQARRELSRAFGIFVAACDRNVRFGEIRFDPFDGRFTVTAHAVGRPVAAATSAVAHQAIDDVVAQLAAGGEYAGEFGNDPLSDNDLAELYGELSRLRAAYRQAEGAAGSPHNPIARVIAISETLIAEVRRVRKAKE